MMRASDYRKPTVPASDPAEWPTWTDDARWAVTAPDPDPDARHFAPIPSDPWDVEGAPAPWPADTDADVWSTTDPADFLTWVDAADAGDEPLDADEWAEELGHLVRQRPHCLDLPLSLALLDGHIAHARRRAGLDAVPSDDDLDWWAVESSARAEMLDALDHLAGAPRRPANDLTDEDVITATSCCG
jgi:hypothetical protein